MIVFKERHIDDEKLLEKASESFLQCANELLNNDKDRFKKLFKAYSLSQLTIALMKLDYTRYNYDQELFSFDQSSDFHFEVRLDIYHAGKVNDILAAYILILDDELEVVGDFLRPINI